MNAQPLYRKHAWEYKIVKYFCGHCGTIHNDEDSAEKCCQSLYCEKCGKEIRRDNKERHYDRYYINPLRCGECYDKDQAAKIPIIPASEYKGEPILDNDRYFSDLDDFFESYECDADELPEWVELCDIEPLPKLDSYDIMGKLIEDCNLEDYENLYNNEEEFHEFAKQWNAKQTGKLWTPNGKRLLITEELKRNMGMKNPCEGCPVYPTKERMMKEGYFGMPGCCLPGVCHRGFMEIEEEEPNGPQTESTT